MNSGASGPKYGIFGQTPAPHTHKKSVTYFAALLLIALFALFTLVLFQQSKQAQKNIERQRLLEVSLQDLIVQSTALRHLNQSAASQTKLSLETQGYQSPQELLNQLAARLAVIEAIEHPEHAEKLENQTQTLRELLGQIDSLINKRQALAPTVLEQWFTGLGLLYNTVNKTAQTSEQYAIQLNQINSIFVVCGLLIAAAAAGNLYWQQSTLRTRVNNKRFQIEAENHTDFLTDLLNLQGWQHALGQHLSKLEQQPHLNSSVAVIDIDYFKQYTDTYGETAGDARLVHFAESLKTNFRPSDQIAKIAEHEFAVLLPNCTATEAQQIIDRMRGKSLGNIEFSAGVCEVEWSQGVARIMAIADQIKHHTKCK